MYPIKLGPNSNRLISATHNRHEAWLRKLLHDGATPITDTQGHSTGQYVMHGRTFDKLYDAYLRYANPMTEGCRCEYHRRILK